MKKKSLIIIVLSVVVVLVIASLYGTFAISSTVSNANTSYNMTLTGSTGTVVVPAYSSKTVIYQITNTNKGKVQYGVAYSGTDITVKIYNDSVDQTSGLIDYGENKFVKLYISNSGSTESSATIKTILGYENGGSLDTLLPSGYSWVTDIYPEITPLSDFTYFLGSEYTTVNTINYYDIDTDAYYDISVAPMTLESNEVLLVKYKGTSKDVYIPDTYTVDDVTYNVVVLSWVYVYYYDDATDFEIDNDDGIFEYNTNIEVVKLGANIKFIVNDGYDTVDGNSMSNMFCGCTSLVNVPEIPSSVTDMRFTFYGCSSLVNAPVIPSSVTNMQYTFYGCTSLVNAPVIPSSVTSMQNTFRGCTSLVNAPEIPNSVTNMSGTFYGCQSLTGTVKINSSSVSSATGIFGNTTNAINVLVPSGSTTYTTLSKLTTSNGMPSNVTLGTY